MDHAAGHLRTRKGGMIQNAPPCAWFSGSNCLEAWNVGMFAHNEGENDGREATSTTIVD